MIEVPQYDATGNASGQAQLSEVVFGAFIKRQTVAELLLRQLAHRRKAHACTKDRTEIRGGGRKPWRQKGTGRARAGSIRSPLWTGGAAAMGPTGEAVFTKEMPRKARRAALRSILTDKARQGNLSVMAAPALSAPKTKDVVAILGRMGLLAKNKGQVAVPETAAVVLQPPPPRSADAKVLFVMPERMPAFEKSCRNLPRVKALLASNLNPHDLLNFEKVVLFEGAVKPLTEVLS